MRPVGSKRTEKAHCAHGTNPSAQNRLCVIILELDSVGGDTSCYLALLTQVSSFRVPRVDLLRRSVLQPPPAVGPPDRSRERQDLRPIPFYCFLLS